MLAGLSNGPCDGGAEECGGESHNKVFLTHTLQVWPAAAGRATSSSRVVRCGDPCKQPNHGGWRQRAAIGMATAAANLNRPGCHVKEGCWNFER